MKKSLMVLCMPDARYLTRLHGYLRERITLPLEWVDYTDTEKLLLLPREDRERTALLVIAAEAATERVYEAFRTVLLLTEEAPLTGEEEPCRTGANPAPEEESKTQEPAGEAEEGNTRVYSISRYLRASLIADKLLSVLGELPQMTLTAQSGLATRIIAYHSPLGRCLQTTMALTAGQLLSTGKRVLYLNFDAFPVSALTAEDDGGDLADLLYYADVSRQKLPVHLERIKRYIGTLPIIPPARSFHQTQGATGREWLSLVRAICEDAHPEYLLLDLSTGVPGLYELLSAAHTVYTVTGHDRQDAEKMEAYRSFLMLNDREDILKKTVFCRLPKDCVLPAQPEQLVKSGFAAYLVKQGLVPGRAA